LVAIGIKARKSQRLIAQELNVTETTIRRDLEVLGITANKKPTATRRKPAVVWKASSPAISNNKPLQPAPRIVVPRPLTLKPKHPSPAIPLSPKELRQQHLEEMLQLVQAWFVERDPDYTRATSVVEKARKLLTSRQDFPVPEMPGSPMSATQLRDHTRPSEMDPASSPNINRREEVCALWLARWLAAWAPEDKQLRYEVLDQAKALLPARFR
jgi:hypothetical protein